MLVILAPLPPSWGKGGWGDGGAYFAKHNYRPVRKALTFLPPADMNRQFIRLSIDENSSNDSRRQNAVRREPAAGIVEAPANRLLL